MQSDPTPEPIPELPPKTEDPLPPRRPHLNVGVIGAGRSPSAAFLGMAALAAIGPRPEKIVVIDDNPHLAKGLDLLLANGALTPPAGNDLLLHPFPVAPTRDSELPVVPPAVVDFLLTGRTPPSSRRFYVDPSTIKIHPQQESRQKMKKRLGGGTRRERKAAREAEARRQAQQKRR